MSKKAIYLLGILLTIVIGSWLYCKYCCKTTCCEKQKESITTIENANNGFYPLKLNGNGIDYTANDNFRFQKNNFEILQPISDSIKNGILLLKNQMDKNPKLTTLITGYCTKDETNTSAFPTLGHARANAIKNYLVSTGIAADRLAINGEVRDAWTWDKDTILGAASFTISETETVTENATEDLNALKESINANPLTLYFNTNQTEISLTAEERQKVANIVKYLDKVNTAKLSCVGHTDNVGDRNNNIKLGQNRADFAKVYFSKNGIGADKIIANSKGPDEPIADNGTAEGKAKNRRTVITIQ